MADLIAILMIGLQYFLVVFAIRLWPHSVSSLVGVTVPFLILAGTGVVLWHSRRAPQTIKDWLRLAARATVLGVVFLGADFLLALLHGYVNPLLFPAGLLGLPLTFFFCPGGLIICLAGIVRAAYISGKVQR